MGKLSHQHLAWLTLSCRQVAGSGRDRPPPPQGLPRRLHRPGVSLEPGAAMAPVDGVIQAAGTFCVPMKPNVLHTCVLNKYRRPVGGRCVCGGGVTHALSAAHSADWPPGGPSARPAPHLAAPLAGQGLPVSRMLSYSCAHSTQSVRGCLDRIYSVSLNYMRVRHSGLGNGFVEGRARPREGCLFSLQQPFQAQGKNCRPNLWALQGQH